MLLAVLRTPGLCLLAVLLCAGCGSAEPRGPWSKDGEPVDQEQLSSGPGPEHCGWQDVHFLSVSWPPGRTYDDPRRKRSYVRDPDGVLADPGLRERYRGAVRLPDDAVDTGYENDDHRLWFATSTGDTVAYLTRGDSRTAEAWPLDTRAIGCD